MKTSPIINVAKYLHILSSVWVFVLALVILIDVFGRVFFLHPLAGTKEILQNSVIAITFLQVPLAIYSGSMLKTTLVSDLLPRFGKKLLRSICYLLGFTLFAAIAYASFPQAIDAYRVNEYEGEGSFRIYTWPVKLLIVITTAYGAVAYITLMVADWRGDLPEDESLVTR